jgi:hypothetical protein
MKANDRNNDLLHRMFLEGVHTALSERLGMEADAQIESYLAEVLVAFSHSDRIFALRDPIGNRLKSVTDMLAEGDVRLNANSFERERQVHKHIGDFILFWSGLYPDFLKQLKLEDGRDLLCDYVRQGQESYYIVSTFDYGRYSDQASMYRRLSVHFGDYSRGLSLLRETLPGGWIEA